MRGKAFLLLLLLLPFRLGAEDKPVPPPLVTDPSQLKARYAEVLHRPEFQGEETLDVSISFEDWLTQWLNQLGEKWNNYTYAGEVHSLATLLMMVMLIVVFGGLIYTTVKLLRRSDLTWPDKEKTPSEQKLFPSPEAFERDIAAAIRSGNWHDAWLAAWRQFLARLEHGQWVEADPTLTNREYLAQLRSRSLPVSTETLLRALVDSYDRTIYGRRVIAETDWLAFQDQVEQATRLLGLNQGKASARRTAL